MAMSQPWNGGGLLAGIGGMNANAPQANDVNGALSLIRENNDIQRSGANNIGLQALQGMGGVAQAYQQAAKQEAQSAFNQAHAQAWETGDTSALRRFAVQNPAFVEQAQQAVAHLNDQQKSDIGALAAGMRVSLSQGPQAFSKYVNENTSALARVGADPNTVLQMGVTDPQQAQQFVDTLGMSSLGGKDYFDTIDKQQGRVIDRGRLQETVRSNQAGEALQSRGQDIQIRGQNISAQNAALSREIQRAELQDKALDRQIARETNSLKLDDLRQKQQDVQQKATLARADRQAAAQGAVDTFSTALDSLGEIEKSPGLAKAVGVRSAFPTVPGSDAANFEARLDTFKAQTFLPMVQSLKGMGALSDAEGKKLSDAVGALSPKMSESAFRSSIGKIRTQLEGKLGNVKKQFDYQEPPPQAVPQQAQQQAQQQSAGFSSLWGD
ncbi:phage DNA ejection protein [Erwinia aphidicola]|uniref:phage DNA ejection protein n=1 Tax=Erwinia aphidicola TaxID=68334 RepID=UPI003BB1DF0E